MKRNISNLVLSLALGVIVLGFTVAGPWKVNEDKYSVKISGTKIEGSFKGLEADIVFDPAHPEDASITASVDATTLSTGFFLKTRHALSEEALNAEKFPAISFQSKSVTKKGSKYEFAGTLTLKGITKNVTIPLAFTGNSIVGEFTGTFKINPKEYNITRHGVPEEIAITLFVPVTR